MSKSTLRDALRQRLNNNSEEVLRALKSSGVMLSKEEETSLRNGNLEGFSDQQLSQRFNSKVLGILGLGSQMGGQQGGQMGGKMGGKMGSQKGGQKK